MNRILIVLALGSVSAWGQASPTDTQRAQSIAKTSRVISDELKAHGDWDKWFDSVAPCRKELAEAAAAAEATAKAKPGFVTGDFAILPTKTSPPLYVPTFTLHYLTAPGPIDQWVNSRPSLPVVVEFSRWLKAQGIDLIFVPAPKVLEVYPERFLGSAPPDRIVVPQMRRLLLDLLNAGVEVVDLLPDFLAEPQKNGELLYIPADTHWSNRAQQISARLIAERLMRYPFVRKALSEPAVYTATDVALPFPGSFADHLNEQQRALNTQLSKIPVTIVKGRDGKPYTDTENAPVVVIGDSYTHYFNVSVKPGSGLDALIAKSINQPVWNISVGAARTEPLKEFIRSPELVKTHKVVVWVITYDLLVLSDRWDKLPFPAAR